MKKEWYVVNTVSGHEYKVKEKLEMRINSMDLQENIFRVIVPEQKEIEYKGHSIECRINSENPNKNFMPFPGKINGINLPGGNGIRIDSAIYSGYTIPPYYDSMIAKIIVHGNSRNEAISKMKRALEELVIDGVETNRDFLFDIIRKPNFIRGDFDTSFIEKEMNKGEMHK